MNPKIDHYIIAGCGRCSLGGTPQCKVNSWQEELKELRRIVLDSGLTEELKWGVPCYTYQKHNTVMIGAFKENCALSFFKGALLHDPNGILKKPGENTQAGRLIRFTDVREIVEMEPILKSFIQDAIALEKSGLKVNLKKNPEPVPAELQKKLDEDTLLKNAFDALTPGKQRAYILYFSAPKQSKTRESRIDKCMQNILDGIGLNDKYSMKK